MFICFFLKSGGGWRGGGREGKLGNVRQAPDVPPAPLAEVDLHRLALSNGITSFIIYSREVKVQPVPYFLFFIY